MTSSKLSGVVYTVCVAFFGLILGLCLWTVLLHPPTPTTTQATHAVPTQQPHAFGDPGGPPISTPAPKTVTECHYSSASAAFGSGDPGSPTWECVSQ